MTRNKKLYEFTFPEECIRMAFQYSVSKSVCQIASYLLFDDEIDFDLMRQALKIEYERNDFLRLRFTKAKDPVTGKKKLYQYFEETMPEVPTPFVDFTGRSREDMLAYLTKEAEKPVKIMKGEALHIIFFRSPDGRCGMEFTISHMIADLFGDMNFYKDLLEVYKALRDGTGMPEPLVGFEEGLARELKLLTSERNKTKTEEYAHKVFSKEDPADFAGIDGGRLITAARKKARNPKFHYVSQMVIFSPKCGLVGHDIDPAKVERYLKFCEENKTTLYDLVYTGARSYLSVINNRQKKVMTQVLIHRRGTKAAKSHGGCYYSNMPLVTDVSEEMSVMEAIRASENAMMGALRYCDSPYMKLLDHYYEIEGQKMGFSACSFLMTVIAPGLLELPEGISAELRGLNTGVATYCAYFMTMPTLKDGELCTSFHYNKRMFKEEEAERFLTGAYRAVDFIVENPDITVGQLMDKLA